MYGQSPKPVQRTAFSSGASFARPTKPDDRGAYDCMT